jgi:hypothetical protein
VTLELNIGSVFDGIWPRTSTPGSRGDGADLRQLLPVPRSDRPPAAAQAAIRLGPGELGAFVAEDAARLAIAGHAARG